jgi:hypothetical protein
LHAPFMAFSLVGMSDYWVRITGMVSASVWNAVCKAAPLVA